MSTFYDPRPLKLRKLDPEAVEKFKENIVRVNQSVPFGKMTSNASDMILVNSLIVAKGSVLQMQMKDFNVTSVLLLLDLHTIVHILLLSNQIHV